MFKILSDLFNWIFCYFNTDSENEEQREEMKKIMFTEENPKKALLIGINYNNDSIKVDDLNGCENDMDRLSTWIKEKCYFTEEYIEKLDSITATKENMMKKIKDLVDFAVINPNSELWFSYSGHGSHYFSSFEEDNQDEIICPADYTTCGFISDNWLKTEFIDKLPCDCKLFVIMDCCHSGSNMDLPYYLYEGIIRTRKENNAHPVAKIVKLSGCLDSQVSIDYYNSQMGEFQGAFTNSFLESHSNNIILNNLDDLNDNLKSKDFKQISELALSEPSLWAWKLC